MSTMKEKIIDALSSEEWTDSNEIAKRTKLKINSVRVTLTSLSANGFVLKKENPDIKGSMLYKRSEIKYGLGVSAKLAEFQLLLNKVRRKNNEADLFQS